MVVVDLFVEVASKFAQRVVMCLCGVCTRATTERHFCLFKDWLWWLMVVVVVVVVFVCRMISVEFKPPWKELEVGLRAYGKSVTGS